MKTIKMIRHGLKTADNHITAECLEGIRKYGIPGLYANINRFHKGSACVRTEETSLAVADWVKDNCGNVNQEFLEADARFGSDAMFAEMITPDFKAMRAETGKGNFEVLRKTSKTEDFERWSVGMYQALEDAFDQLDDGDVCIIATHSPTVEMLVNRILGGNLVDLQTKELEGVTFFQDDHGTIFVTSLCA